MSGLPVVLWATICLAVAKDVKFPPWFKFGTSTASYQVEGGWNSSDKSESIWDHFTHGDRTVVSDLTNGDVSIDSYHLWRRDVEMAAELGLDFYRFSISWTRLMPTGFSNKISQQGYKYYSNLIDALLEKGVEPLVTIYHWDLPQNLQDLGGWTNPLIVDWFASYARVVFYLFADRVKTFITINEPIVVCDFTYTTGAEAPGVEDHVFAPYLCNKHLLLAHAKAWRIYDEHFKPLYHGKVSISNHLVWYSPLTPKDDNLTKMARDFAIGRYTHPIYSKEGGWPASVVQVMKEVSAKEGYEWSRLPAFSDEEIKLIKGTYDFFALNYYTCRRVRKASLEDVVSLLFFEGIPELGAVMEKDPTASHGASALLTLCPKGLRSLLSWIKEQYGELEMLITENGYSDSGSNLKDYQRVEFIRDHLEQILLSVYVDSVNVTGYTYWSLMDNFEWTDGFRAKFGLYEVDLKSPNHTRTPRLSAKFYSQVIRNHSVPLNSTEALKLP